MFSYEALFNIEATDDELIEQLKMFMYDLNGTGEQLIQMISLAPVAGIAAHTSRLLTLLQEKVMNGENTATGDNITTDIS